MREKTRQENDSAKQDKQSAFSVKAWIFYSWADSAFALCIMAGFFPVLFRNYYLSPELVADSTAKLGFANGISGIIAALLCPIFAAFIAQKDSRQKSLAIFTLLAVFATILLFFVQGGQYYIALFLFIAANIFYRLCGMCHDSLLPAVAVEKKRHRVSAIGFSAGYLGGAIIFILNIFMVSEPSFFGFDSSVSAAKFCILTAGLWWLVFSLPIFYAKIPRTPARSGDNESAFDSFWKNLKETAVFAWKNPKIRMFLIAYWFYIDGVHSFVMMAADYGLSLGFSPERLMVSLLAVQLTAFPFAVIAGLAAQKFGARKILLSSIAIYAAITLSAAWTMNEEWQFTMFAVLVGLVQGGIQSVSRSYFSLMIPGGKQTELFGLFNMLGRFAVATGPVLIAVCIIIAQNLGFEGKTPQRIGISSLVLPFAIGFILLTRVRHGRLHRAQEAN